MTIELRELPIDDILLLDKNPRKINSDEFEKLKQDIKDDPGFLFQRPPLINLVEGKHNCYAGTQRVKAAKALGYTKIKCFIEHCVPEALQDERMLKDNLHRGIWDEAKLLDLNIDLNIMSDFGFKDFEVGIFDTFEIPDEPKDLTAPLKDAPPTLKITFTDSKQMEYFECLLKDMIDENTRLTTISYSVSQGEI